MGVGSRFPQWRLSDVNRNFDLCPTYPRLLCVPAKISDAVLYHAAKFRSRGRLPALSYVYARNGMSITRSSQPLVGIKAKRSIQDEKLIEAVFDSHLPVGGALPMVNSMIGAGGVPEVASMDGMMATSAVHSNKNVIIDARPLGNAMANRAMVRVAVAWRLVCVRFHLINLLCRALEQKALRTTEIASDYSWVGRDMNAVRDFTYCTFIPQVSTISM